MPAAFQSFALPLFMAAAVAAGAAAVAIAARLLASKPSETEMTIEEAARKAYAAAHGERLALAHVAEHAEGGAERWFAASIAGHMPASHTKLSERDFARYMAWVRATQ